MGYERYPRGTNPQDYGRDYGSGSEFSYSSARDYEAAGEIGERGRRDYGDRDYYRGGYGREPGRVQGRRPYYGSYASDGHRFEEVSTRDSVHARDDGRRQDRDYGRQPEGYDYEERGFISRAGDEVRSWFGDDEAERRRELDQRHDERGGGRDAPHARDADYHHWRKQQIASLDRDYDEYRQENRSKFHNEFGSWRQERQGQRNSLNQVAEHMDVVGSDGEHVGTVDKVRGDRILLTKSDPEAGGHHHSIPSRWIQSVDDKVTIRKTASDAQAHWKDEERSQALFPDNRADSTDHNVGAHNLNRSFSGTY